MIGLYRERISRLEKDIVLIEREEKAEKVLNVTEHKMDVAQRLVSHPDQIGNKTHRAWFQSRQDRMHEKGIRQAAVGVIHAGWCACMFVGVSIEQVLYTRFFLKNMCAVFILFITRFTW